ncbi:MAG TPA: phage portal protein, partial [Pirellulales bacterium]|nr:phage portal protein [Pirellulales bacterium]
EVLFGQPGEEMKMLNSSTPGANHIPHVKLQLALCASALSMPYEFFTLDLSGLEFSRQKGMLLLVNYAIRPWRRWLIDSFLSPLWNWRVSKAMGPKGELSPAPSPGGVSEWSKVQWQCPAEITIDRQQDMQADMLEIQAGFLTLGQATKRRGYDFEEQIDAKAQEQKMIEATAAKYKVDPSTLSKMQIPGQTDAIEQATATPTAVVEDGKEDE